MNLLRRMALLGSWGVFVGALACGGIKSAMTENVGRNQRMNMEMRLAMLISIVPENGGSDVILETDNALRLHVSDPEILMRAEEFYTKRELVIVLYDRQSRNVNWVSLPPTDVLQALGPATSAADEVMVHLLKSPRLFRLKKTHPRFKELYSLLEQALGTEKQVSLAVFAGGTVVEDVRIAASVEER